MGCSVICGPIPLAPLWSSPTGCRGICSSTCNTSFPAFFSHLYVQRAIFHTIFPHCCLVFFPFLNPLSLRYHHLGCWAHPCPAVGLLELAGTSSVQHGGALQPVDRGTCTQCKGLFNHIDLT